MVDIILYQNFNVHSTLSKLFSSDLLSKTFLVEFNE